MGISKFARGFILGFIVATVIMTGPNDSLNAEYNPLDISRGAVEWNPVFVKIVK